MEMRLKDKVVLVTAATKGIGLACVKACAENGARVYMGARNETGAVEVAGQLYPIRPVYYDAAKAETYASMMGRWFLMRAGSMCL